MAKKKVTEAEVVEGQEVVVPEGQEGVTPEVLVDENGNPIDTTLPEGTPETPKGEAKADEVKYIMQDGKEGSRAAFIREQYLVLNKNRKEISEEFGFEYRVVYSATANLENAGTKPTRGRSASSATIKLFEGKVVSEVEETIPAAEGAEDQTPTVIKHIALNGEVQAEFPHAFDAEGIYEIADRNTWIVEQVKAGVERSDVAKYLDLSYGVIYGLTKEDVTARATYEIEYNGKTMTRSEYIRTKYAEGMTKAEIAKDLNVEYSVVWTALKATKNDAEKFAELISKLEGFKDKLTTPVEEFEALIGAIKNVGIKVEEEKAEEATEEATEGSPVVEGEAPVTAGETPSEEVVTE